MMIKDTLDFLPHGVCWLWDWKLVIAHSVGDLLTFLAYMIIPLTAIYVFRNGRLNNLLIVYPRLWVLGTLFVGTCGLSHLGSFLEVWIGGSLYYITGLNKLLMAVVSLWFAIEFCKIRNEIIVAGRVLEEIHRQDQRKTTLGL